MDRFVFNSADFGQPPSQNLESSSSNNSRLSDHPPLITSFQQKNSSELFAGYAITSPRYDYYQDQLFRIKFRFKVAEEDQDHFLDTIRQHLRDQYQMSYVTEKVSRVNEFQTTYLLVLESPSGVVARIVRHRYGNCWAPPYIKLQKTEIIDKLNHEMNPNYIARAY
jgi:hypothetical protein